MRSVWVHDLLRSPNMLFETGEETLNCIGGHRPAVFERELSVFRELSVRVDDVVPLEARVLLAKPLVGSMPSV